MTDLGQSKIGCGKTDFTTAESDYCWGICHLLKASLERKRVPCLPSGFCLKVQHFKSIFHDSPLRFA